MNQYQKNMALIAEAQRNLGATPTHHCIENNRFIDYYAGEYDDIMSYHPLPEDERIHVKWVDEHGITFEWCIDPESTYGGWWSKSTQDYESSGVLETSRLFGRTCVVGYDGAFDLPQAIQDSLTRNIPNLI